MKNVLPVLTTPGPYGIWKICQAEPFTEEVQKTLGSRFSLSKQVDSVCLQHRWGGGFSGDHLIFRDTRLVEVTGCFSLIKSSEVISP